MIKSCLNSRCLLLTVLMTSALASDVDVVEEENRECDFENFYWNENFNQHMKTCFIKWQTIYEENLAVSSGVDYSVEGFVIQDNKDINFLPVDVGKTFPSLVGLKVQNCSVTHISSDAFAGMNKLIGLFLRDNEIVTIDVDAFRSLKVLRDLDLSQNYIESLAPNVFKSLRGLESLNLDDNHLETLDEQLLENLESLKELSISRNFLESIPEKFFFYNLRLSQINLVYNNLTYLSANMFDDLRHRQLSFVNLGDNLCVNADFGKFPRSANSFHAMKNHLRENCLPPPTTISPSTTTSETAPTTQLTSATLPASTDESTIENTTMKEESADVNLATKTTTKAIAIYAATIILLIRSNVNVI